MTRTPRREFAIRLALVVGALVAVKIGIDQQRLIWFGRPGWLVPLAIAGLLFCLATRPPVTLPYRFGRPVALGGLPVLLIVNSMLAFEGIHVMPTGWHFGPMFAWTLTTEALTALAILVGMALASGFTERPRDLNGT